MRHAAKSRDFFFERNAFAPQDKLLGGKHTLDRFANFTADGGILRRQIKLWNRTIGNREWIRAHAANNPGRGRMRMNSRTRGELFFRKFRAKSDGIVWIDGAGLFFHRLNHAFFVDDEGGALRPIIFFFLDVVHFQDAVLFQHFAVHVAEQREGYADFLRESVVGGRTVDADAENDSVGSFELGHISLIGLKFFCSTFGEGQNVKGQDDIFLAAVVTQVDLLPLVVEQRKVRSHVAGLQRSVRDFDAFLRANGASGQAACQCCRNDQGFEMQRTHARLLRYCASADSIRRENALRNPCLPVNTRIYKFFKCASLKGEPKFSRNSSQCSSGMDMKTSTTLGSNWVPEQRLISPLACERGKALRYGRSLIMASSESAMVKMRAPRGMSSPFRPRG